MDDIDALFGGNQDFVDNLIQEAKSENQQLAVLNAEEARIDVESLQQHIVNKGDEMLEKAKDAVEEVLLSVQSEPTNGEIINAASNILGSYTRLLGELNKLSATNERFKQQKELMQMKIKSDESMNTQNNQTALLLKRDEVMKQIMEAQKHFNTNDIIDT